MNARIKDQIRTYIGAHFARTRNGPINDNDRLLEHGIVDSLGVLEVVSYVEQEFRIAVSDEELVPENFESVERLAAFVTAKVNGDRIDVAGAGGMTAV